MKYKLLRLSLLSALVLLCGGGIFALGHALTNTQADPEVTLDFTDKSAWDIPTSGSSNKDLATFTNGTYSIKLYATNNYKLNTGYLILGKQNSYLEFPAFDFDVEKIEVTGTDGASASVKQNIYVGNEAVSTETTGAKNVTHTYEIAEAYQAAGNIYRLMVTSSHNTQITYIKVYKKVAGDTPETPDVTVATPAIMPDGGEFTDEQTVSISCETEGATIYYTTDDTEPTAESTVYTEPFTVYETTTVKAIAIKDDVKSAVATSTIVQRKHYGTIAELQAAVSNTSTPVSATLNNVFVTAVKGSNAYLADADGYGLLIYQSGHGLEAGTAISIDLTADLVLYRGQTELANLTINSLNTVENSEFTPLEKSIADITTANQSCVVTLKGVKYADGKLTDGENTITYYDNFSVDYTFDADKAYDVTGVVIVYNTTLEIAPRTAADITEAATTPEEPVGFRDIKLNLMEHSELLTGSPVYITVAEDGTIGTTDDAAKAAATIQANAHGSYGCSNFTASVPVEGCVKITYATHDYGNDITVTNEAGEQVAKLNTNGAKWMNDHSNVAVAYYRTNEPTTLHFSKANYNPYFAVEAIAEEDLPAEVTVYTVTFDKGDAEGVAPAAIEVNAGDAITLPKNYTLYKEGYTLTGWADTSVHAIGEQLTPEADLTLTPVFTQNEVSLADRTAAVIINYALDGYNDNPKHNFQGGDGIIVTQATVNGQTIDVATTTNGKFAHNGSGWHQVNAGTKVTVPSAKGAIITVKTYQDANALKFGDTAAEAGAEASYTATADDATLVIEQTANGYWNKLTITLPKPESEEPGPEPHDPVSLIWDYTETAPSANPDNGLYYESKVNDPAGTKNGLKGIKLDSNGYAYFEKPAVAGKLTLTIGKRDGTGDFCVDVYSCTITDGVADTDNMTLIATTDEVQESNPVSVEIPADVTGIYIKRNTASEGVLSKIVFKETVVRTFVDFEITNEELSGAFDASTLPAGVTFTGTQRNDTHGYGNVTIVVPVDGTVKFTIGGCQYANPADCKVTNAEGEVLATPTLKTEKCYHQDGTVVTYFYTGAPTTLTFSNIAYLPYFKAEATEVQEVTITYKDQNGEVLGTKQVFEGEAIGEVPYTEADLTIDEGFKFRGWVYGSGIKVKPADTVNGNVTVSASVTAIETAPTVGSVQTYDLTKATFYPEDHENFNVEGGSYYNNHGFTFNAGGKFEVAVGGKAQIVLALCQYGNGTTIKVTDAAGNVIRDDVPAKAEADGGTTAVNYDGEAGMLTFTFDAQTYLHSVTVYNVNEFVEKDAESGYYIVTAGDAAGFVLALNAASSEPNSKIFLPNGTYDLGETVLTTVSGTNVSIIGESMEGVIIKTAPDVKLEGLGSADLLVNTGTGLYLQDLTLQNALDYYAAGSAGRAVTLHDKGTQTINKNVRHLSYQDTYYSHKVGGVFYFEGGEIHGTVDYMCGNGKVYFNEVKLVNEQRSSATMTANSELYVFNNCTVENNADNYNFGRAWSDHPVCIWLNTTLNAPDKLANTRWNLSGINCDYSIAGEYGTKNADGTDITPESNTVTFAKENTTLNTILTAEQAATYTIDYVLGDWAATAKAQATQVEAPIGELKDGTISWTAVADATAYAIYANGELLTITTETSYVVEQSEATARRADGEVVYTIRAANGRGGFGEPKTVTVVTGINAINTAADFTGKTVYDLQGRRVLTPTTGEVYIIDGKKVMVK